jgi:hypothetical protein
MKQDRLERVEDKVDQLKEDVTEIKVEFREHKRLIEEHITGDKKIIDHIVPILGNLKDMSDDYVYERERKERRTAFLKKLTLIFGALSAALTAIAKLSGLL